MSMTEMDDPKVMFFCAFFQEFRKDPDDTTMPNQAVAHWYEVVKFVQKQ